VGSRVVGYRYCFEVKISPRGKDRPKGRIIGGKGRKPFISIYTPKATIDWEKSFAAEVKLLGLNVPEEIPLDVAIVAVFPRPQFMQRRSKRDGSLLGGWLERSYLHSSKPDADNVAKIVLDALSDHFEDSRVAVLTAHKFIAALDESPRVFVRVQEASSSTSADVIADYQLEACDPEDPNAPRSVGPRW